MKKTLAAASLAALLCFNTALAFTDTGAGTVIDPSGNTPNNNATGSNATNQEGRLQNRQTMMQERQGLDQQGQALTDQRCSMIQDKIAGRMANFDSVKAKHTAVYANMTSRIQKFIDRLSASGVDTTTVKNDLATINTKISKFSTDLAASDTKLGSTKDFACGHSNGQFMGALQEARKSFLTVRQDAMDIRSFMQTKVIPDILALKKQKAMTNVDQPTENRNGVGTGAGNELNPVQ